MVLKKGQLRHLLIWWSLFLGLQLPAVYITYQAYIFNLGADPAKVIVDHMGRWTLYILWLTLLISSLARLPSLRQLLRYRRMVGLYSFYYAVLHLLSFLTFIAGWRTDIIVRELLERPYIYVGFVAWLILALLAITSLHQLRRKLKKHWYSIHKLVYVAAVLVMIHVAWLVRSSYQDLFIYGFILALLFAERIYQARTVAK